MAKAKIMRTKTTGARMAEARNNGGDGVEGGGGGGESGGGKGGEARMTEATVVWA